MTPQAFCEALEKLNISKQKEASAFLCVAQPRVSDYRSGKRKVPGYIEASLQAHLLLSPEQLSTIRKIRGVD